MKNSKRFLTLLLTLVMLVGVFTVAASAAEVKIDVIFDTNGDGLNDTYDNASFVEGSDGKVKLNSFEGCTAWTANGAGNYAVGTELGWNELIAIAPSGGTVVFAPVVANNEGNQGGTTTPPAGTKKYTLSIDYYVVDAYYDYDYGYGCGYGCNYKCNHTYENWYDGGNNFGWHDTPWFDSSWDKDYGYGYVYDRNWGCDEHYEYRSTCYFCVNGNKTNNGYKPNYNTNTSVKINGEGSYEAGKKVTISVSSSFTSKGVKYYFAGWSGKGTFANKGKSTTTYTMPARDTVIYAMYAPYGATTNTCNSKHTHTVVYTDGVKNQTVFSDIVKTVRHNGTTPTVKDPVRPGYRFTGWSPKVAKNTTKCTVYEAQWSKAVAPKLTDDCVAYLKGYGKGEFRPDNNMTRGEFAVLLYRLLDDATVKAYKTTENDFSDVKADDWYNEAISTLANAAVIESAKTYRPTEYITRAEMVAMLAAFYTDDVYAYDYYDEICTCKYNCNHKSYSYSKSAAKYTCSYKDVPSNYWAYDQISLAQKLGWVKGYGGNTFLPDATITRAEVAAIINRVLDRDCDVKDTKNYVDVAKDAWYYADVLEASIAH